MDSKLDTVRDALNLAIIIIGNYKRDTDFLKHAIYALSAIDPEAISPSEDTEKLCHQIYDVLPISQALKLLDDGRLYALITAHDEAIRRALRSASNIVKETALEIGLDDEEVFSISGIIDPDIPGNYEDIIEGRACLSTEPAQDDGKPEAFASAIVKELRVNWAFDTEDALSVLNGAKRRLEEAKE